MKRVFESVCYFIRVWGRGVLILSAIVIGLFGFFRSYKIYQRTISDIERLKHFDTTGSVISKKAEFKLHFVPENNTDAEL